MNKRGRTLMEVFAAEDGEPPKPRDTPFAARLRDLRAAASLSQEQLADALFVEVATVASWERGRREPAIARLADLALALGVRERDFFEE